MKPKIKIVGETIIVNDRVLADALGISERYVRTLAEDDNGVVVRVGPSEFNFTQSVYNYIENLRNEKKEQKEQKTEADTALTMEKLNHEKLKTRKTELELQLLEKEMHIAADVERVWNAGVINAKTRLLSIPEKIAPMLVGIEDVKEIKTILKHEMHEALHEVAAYDVSKFEKTLSEGNNKDAEESET